MYTVWRSAGQVLELKRSKTFRMLKNGVVAGMSRDQMQAAKRRCHRRRPSRGEANRGRVSTNQAGISQALAAGSYRARRDVDETTRTFRRPTSREDTGRDHVSSNQPGRFAGCDRRMCRSRPMIAFRGL
ncbi:hypothetical protein DY000_02035491 [Brassica cretica]|uniref:Uncharacterized protein n=1 Tax=Brassica cretica TaxID=69181 RepID=A0ABQ7DFG5_BRACR|nr:hypothetical protein DY000_02035491 [Brassica cretica]